MKLRTFNKKFVIGMLGALTFLSFTGLTANAQKLKPEEILAKHLDAVASESVRKDLKSNIAVGDVLVKYVSQKNPDASGRVVLASSGVKTFLGYNLNVSDYPGERMIFDGNKPTIDNVLPGGRSPLGNFLQANSVLITNGLFGGVLTTNWALFHVAENRPKLGGGSIKKHGGKEYYVIDYSPRGGSDLTISLFFDKETFRHTRSEYSRISSAAIGRTIDQSARQHETRFKVSEDFSDFKEFSGATLPQGYKFEYLVTGANGTTEIHWTYKLTEFSVNQSLDDATFSTSSK